MCLCVYEGGCLFFATSLRLARVPPPVVGGAARFLSLETVRTVTSPAMPHSRGDVNTAQEAARAHQLLLCGPFCERAFLKSLSHERQEGPEGTTAPQWRGVLLIARYHQVLA